MTKLYKKSEISFAILWIVAYVVLSSLADQLSESYGIIKSVTAVLHIAMSLILFFWIRNNDLSEKYGFCRSTIPAKRFLYYLPLIIIASTAFWSGIKLQYGYPGALLYFISMCCVGFLEEVIFRGLLFRAMEKDNLKTAMIVSSLTFGLGHIVNLFNGSGMDLASSMTQIVLAVLLGFVLVLIFYYGKSLIPCILFHSANNALQVFSADGSLDPQTEMVLNLVVIAIVLGGYSLYLVRAFSMKEK
ncbi:MAG: CPBP family intramembrane metalloprotease [Oscillospiraceae bacterium]|nr:CPBP family intramembrane metalloprotease [Oscillospiraceae bacterium]MBQ5869883.1 CPBP family intramembrane metalloprotease [Lachnospiraceae bacterium]